MQDRMYEGTKLQQDRNYTKATGSSVLSLTRFAKPSGSGDRSEGARLPTAVPSSSGASSIAGSTYDTHQE